MAFTLEQLRGFLAVAEELHFGRAATRLKMTQPPLSRQIQKLERAVGAQLLERDNRRVTLTAAGEVFLGEARRLLSLADTAPELARRVSSGSHGVVRIGFTAASTYGTLGRLLDVVERALPDIGLDLHEMVTREQVAALLNEENAVHTVSQVLTMLWLVAAGRGIAFVPESAARLPIEGVEFVRLETSVPEPVELHLLWARESRNPALDRVLELLARSTVTF
jgi:DNA-binding transcriptional LysR family regulator